MIDRRRLSQTKRAAVIARQDNRCTMCGNVLVPGQIDFDHIQALVHGGDNADDNWRALCRVPCHASKTKADKQGDAKADRVAVGGRQRKAPPMPGSRASKFKRRMNGTVERRA